MRIAVRNYQGKATLLENELGRRGHQLVRPPAPADLLLTDADWLDDAASSIVASYPAVIRYPHGGFQEDMAPAPNTSELWVQGPGQARHTEILYPDFYVCAIGLPYCRHRPFRPATRRRVLFAPEHHSGDGSLEPGVQEVTRRVFDALMRSAWVEELTVRWVPVEGYSHGVEHLGVELVDGVRYQAGGADVADGVAALEDVDLVVAELGTFPCLAIARGVPTVMYTGTKGFVGCDEPYPYDATDVDDLDGLLADAANVEAYDWRTRWVGHELVVPAL